MQNKHLKQIFFWPAIIGLLNLFGLVTALLVDASYWEHLANGSLAMPLAVIFYFYWIKQ